MVKKIFANKLAKKGILFAAAFALLGVIMVNVVSVSSNESEMLAQTAVLTRPTDWTPLSAVFANWQPEKPKPLANPEEETPAPDTPVTGISNGQEEGFVYLAEIPMSRELQAYTYQRCKEQNVDYELVLAIMWRESRFQVDAVNVNTNGTQDNGIMQINDVNKAWLFHEHGIDDLMDPLQNIDAGTALLTKLIQKYGEHDALMAYQYGEAGMNRKFEEGITTNDQVALVMKKRGEFTRMRQAKVMEEGLRGTVLQLSHS